MEVIVSERGSIQIPNEIMEKMELKPGDEVYFQLEGLEKEDTLVVKKAKGGF